MLKIWNAKGWIKKVLSGGAILSLVGYFATGAISTTVSFVKKANATSENQQIDHVYMNQKFQNEDDKAAALEKNQDKMFTMIQQIYTWEREDHK